MLSFDECVQLLGDILPLFEENLDEAAKRAPTESHEWMFFVELQTQFHTLKMFLPDLSSKLAKRRAPCMEVLKSVLGFLEEAIKSPGVPSSMSVYAFPLLESLRRDGTLSDTQSIIPYNGLAGSDAVLGRFDIWMKKLERLMKYTTAEIRHEKPRSHNPRPSNLIREMAIELMAAAERCWHCACSSPHDLMLFLRTYRGVRDSDDHVMFKMLFARKNEIRDQWREGNVYVMLPTTEGAGVAFDLPRKAPRRREPLPNLCAHLKNMSHSTSVNMRLQNARFYQTRPSRPQFKLWDAIPGQSIGDLLDGRPILSAQSKIILAVLVSYSVFHFNNTSWLPFGWDNSHFYVPKLSEVSPFALRPLLVSKIGLRRPSSSYTPSTIHKHPDLLQLGILLLEIFLKKPIEDMCKAEDLGPGGELDSDANFYTADRVYDDHDWDVHEGYKSAVAACLRCDAPITGPPYDELEYAHYIYDNVISPLQRELKALCDLDVDQLYEKVDAVTFNDSAKAAATMETTSTPETPHQRANDSKIMAAIFEGCSW
jgi:hypothetical protein